MDQPQTRPASQDKVARDFDRFRDTYTEQIRDAIAFSGLEREFFIHVKSDWLLRLAGEHFGDLGRVTALDLGCGIGAYHASLADKFKALSAIDVSEESVKYARSRYPSVSYASYSGGRLPYEDTSFDLVFAICVIHHVPPDLWREFAAEMYRVTKPGGLALVFEHNPYNPATQYITRTCPIDADAVLLTASRAKRLLADAKFAIRDSKTILSVPPLNRLAGSVDRLLGYLPFGAQYYVKASKP